MSRIVQRYRPGGADPHAPSPFAWGDPDKVDEWLGSWFRPEDERGTSCWRARDGAAVWEAFAAGYGPIVSLGRCLDPLSMGQLRAEFIELHERFRTGGGVLVQRPYVVFAGQRIR